MKIYVIAENIPTVEKGTYVIEQAICPSLGYWTDENLAECEAKVQELNEAAIADNPDDDKYADRYSIVPVNKSRPKMYKVEWYELHCSSIVVEADNPTEAVKKVREGEGEYIDGSSDFIELADSYGMSKDQQIDAGINPDDLDGGILCGIRSVEEYYD